MKTMLDNFINGNLSDARRQAKRFNYFRIVEALQEDYGFSMAKALATAGHLKGFVSFQRACDEA